MKVETMYQQVADLTVCEFDLATDDFDSDTETGIIFATIRVYNSDMIKLYTTTLKSDTEFVFTARTSVPLTKQEGGEISRNFGGGDCEECEFVTEDGENLIAVTVYYEGFCNCDYTITYNFSEMPQASLMITITEEKE